MSTECSIDNHTPYNRPVTVSSDFFRHTGKGDLGAAVNNESINSSRSYQNAPIRRHSYAYYSDSRQDISDNSSFRIMKYAEPPSPSDIDLGTSLSTLLRKPTIRKGSNIPRHISSSGPDDVESNTSSGTVTPHKQLFHHSSTPYSLYASKDVPEFRIVREPEKDKSRRSRSDVQTRSKSNLNKHCLEDDNSTAISYDSHAYEETDSYDSVSLSVFSTNSLGSADSDSRINTLRRGDHSSKTRSQVNLQDLELGDNSEESASEKQGKDVGLGTKDYQFRKMQVVSVIQPCTQMHTTAAEKAAVKGAPHPHRTQQRRSRNQSRNGMHYSPASSSSTLSRRRKYAGAGYDSSGEGRRKGDSGDSGGPFKSMDFATVSIAAAGLSIVAGLSFSAGYALGKRSSIRLAISG